MQIISTLGTRNMKKYSKDIPFVGAATGGRWKWDLSKDCYSKSNRFELMLECGLVTRQVATRIQVADEIQMPFLLS